MTEPREDELPRERSEYVPPTTIPRGLEASAPDESVKLGRGLDPRQATTQVSLKLTSSGARRAMLGVAVASALGAVATYGLFTRYTDSRNASRRGEPTARVAEATGSGANTTATGAESGSAAAAATETAVTTADSTAMVDNAATADGATAAATAQGEATSGAAETAPRERPTPKRASSERGGEPQASSTARSPSAPETAVATTRPATSGAPGASSGAEWTSPPPRKVWVQ